jgi:ABC-2 type transport system ATP-binding protein
MLELNELHRRFDDVVALDGMTFTVEAGKVVGFLGPNGAGKTTAMRAVLGVTALDSGTIRFDGREVDVQARRHFGYMPEERGLYPGMQVLDQLVYLGRLHGMDAAAALRSARRQCERLGLAERVDSKVEELSLGNQQRVQLAAALVHDPDLLVLDEPFSGLDPVGIDDLSAVLAERAHDGATVLFSSHQLDLVEDVCEDVVIINRGRIATAGPIDDLRAASARRHLEVEVAGNGNAWLASRPDLEVVEARDDFVRLLVPADIDLAAALAAASAAGPVRRFTFQPPTLSELFMEAVAA